MPMVQFETVNESKSIDRFRTQCYPQMSEAWLAMIYTAQAGDGGELFTLVSVDGENFFSVPFQPEPGGEDELESYIEPQYESDEAYMGFSKEYLQKLGATFGAL